MKTLKIKDICEKGSSSLKQKDIEGKDGKYPVFGASGYISSIDTYHQDKEYIAIVKDGSGIGRVNFMPAYSSVIGTMQYILPKEGYNIKYISYCLQSLDLSKYKQGAAIPHIYFRDYGEKFVNVEDSLIEQERIVSFLDAQFARIDAIKANAEELLQEAKALFQNALKDLLTPKEGWEEKLLKNILLDSENIRWQDVDKNKEYGYIDLTSVSRETKEVISPSIINSSNAPSRAKQIVKSGDLIFATTRPTLRRFCLISDVYDSQICSTGFCLLRPNKQILSSFLFYILFSDDFYFYIEPLQTGASYPAVSDNIVKNYTIYLPSILEQEKIVEKLDELREKITQLQSNYSQTVTLCEDLKKSLLKDIFS